MFLLLDRKAQTFKVLAVPCQFCLSLGDFDILLDVTLEKQANFYREIAGDPHLQVAALIRQANLYFYRKRPMQILQMYQQAAQFLNLCL